MANFRYSHLYTTKTGSSAITAAEQALKQAEIALAIAVGEEKLMFKNADGDVVTISTSAQIEALIQTLREAIETEASRATSAETALDNKIGQEIADRESDVDAEQARAVSAETALDNKIDEEEARAEAAEEVLSDRISAIESGSTQALEDEIARATAAEEALSDAIEDEADERESADTALLTAIEAEVQNRIADVDAEESRAVSAETALDNKIDGIDDKIDDEIADRKAEAVASVDYDSNAKTIDFYNYNNVKIDSIDATDFIKDGMIDSVSIETTGGTSYLVIVWNTDAGKETTRIDIGDLFEADNYYTKDEVDYIVSGLTDDVDEELEALNDAISGETARATAAEEALEDAIDAEETARDNADVKSMAVDANAGITLTLGNGDTIVATEAAEITLSAGEF